MEKTCQALYNEIKSVYDNKDIRSNPAISNILLKALNKLIEAKNVQQTALSLNRELRLYEMSQKVLMPKALLSLKSLTRKLSAAG